MYAAIVLAAGESRRMGRPKMLLPWAGKTVVRHVVDTLAGAGIDDVVVVTGGAGGEVEAALHGASARVIHNPHYTDGEMLHSCRIGLEALSPQVDAVLIALGDQPQIEGRVVRAVMAARPADPRRMVVPSYQMHRGHPWLLPRTWWNEVQQMRPPQTLRDFLNTHQADIDYITVDSPSILQDLDTPEDYNKHKPE
jgi:molybdenum cofactor cytidylyltransferase